MSVDSKLDKGLSAAAASTVSGGSSDGPLVYDRRRGEWFREVVLGDRWLKAAYRGPFRRVSRRLLFRHAFISRVMGWYADSRLSRGRIRPTIEQLGIDVEEFRDPVDHFRTFNDFFCRRLRPEVRPFERSPEVLASPADCRILAFEELDGESGVPVKGCMFTLVQLAGPGHEDLCARFSGGSAAICRLCPADYHRFHYPASGEERDHWAVPGTFHSVNPFVLDMGLNVFAENRRVVNVLEFERFGAALFVEVGAFAVAAIEQTHERGPFNKMEEKGMFRFGGSTLILALEPGAVTFDADLCDRTRQGIETRVLCGETIGRTVRAAF